jgi:hypothetical protein
LCYPSLTVLKLLREKSLELPLMGIQRRVTQGQGRVEKSEEIWEDLATIFKTAQGNSANSGCYQGVAYRV